MKIPNIFRLFSKKQPAPPTVTKTTEAPVDEIKKTLFYDDLSPVDSVPADAPYEEAIQWALENNNIYNIALTGPYGSGKSSIIKTFEKNHKQYNYLNISLASFKEEMPVVKTKEQITEESRLIELSIIQQMFYKVSESRIPDSRFKRIRSLTEKQIKTRIKFSLMAIIGLVILLRPKFLIEMALWRNLMGWQEDLIYFISIGLIAPLLIGLLKYSFRAFNGSKLNKLNLSSGEIEINPKSETSILNKHIDEILYFFEVTCFDVVVIEDLDRFNDPEIFTKLRELNVLINKAEPIAAQKRVRFIYAIKDDMFRDKTRTKFFDFIIPVIPVINSTNSLDIMLKKIDQPELKLDISENFLSDITLYIDDMRALKNIFNEFLIYKENLQSVKIKQEKLFSIIVYKNIYPNDFAELHENKGEVFLAFESKPKIIADILAKKAEQIKAIQKEIFTIHNSNRLKSDELRKLYLFGLVSLIPSATSIALDGTNYNWSDLSLEENFNKLINQSNISYYQNSYGNRNSGQSFKNVEDAVDKQLSYNERLKQLTDRENNTINVLQYQIDQINQEIAELKQQPLSHLLETFPGSIDMIGEKFKKMKLLVYLIREGFIDEMYPSLISYFYEGSLAQKDMEFLMSVKDREALPYNHPLEKTETLLKRLTTAEFGRHEIFNNSLIDFLISTKATRTVKWDRFIAQFADPDDKTISFIDEYTKNGSQIPKFIVMLAKQWPNMVLSLLHERELTDENREIYLKLIILHCEMGDFKNMDNDGYLSEFINEKENFIQLFDKEQYPRVEQVLKKLDVRFESLALDGFEEDLLLISILDNNLFALNALMVELYIKIKHKDKSDLIEKLKTANYTTILSIADQQLTKYIEGNIDEYIGEVVVGRDENIEESEASIIRLLNNAQLDEELKSSIIETQNAKIKDIKKVPVQVWEEIFDNLMADANWHNVVAYYQHNEGFDEVVDRFINEDEVNDKLSKSMFNSIPGFDDTAKNQFSFDFLLNVEISIAAFTKITAAYSYYYDNALKINDLDETRLRILIQNKVIRLSKSNFDLFKESYPTLNQLLVEKHFGVYKGDKESYPLTSADFTYLLNSKILAIDQKRELVEMVTTGMVQESVELANLIAAYLPGQIFKQREFDFLNALFNNTDRIMDKAAIFNGQLQFLDFQQIEILLLAIGHPYDKLTEKHKSPKLDISDLNWSIAGQLDRKGYVSSIKESKDKIKVNTKH